MTIAQIFSLFICLIVGGISPLWGEKPINPKTFISSVSVDQKKFLKVVDKKYQKQHGVYVDLEKVVISETLGARKPSKGEAWIDHGKMRMEIYHPQPAKIVADGKYIWVVTPPPKEFKRAKTQVIKASLTSKRAKSQGLIQLLTQGGLLKYFKIVGVKPRPKQIIYFLQPKTQSAEFKRAQVTIKVKQREIVELFYWDHMDNETQYKFLKTKFNQKVDKKKFIYIPPKDAELVVF